MVDNAIDAITFGLQTSADRPRVGLGQVESCLEKFIHRRLCCSVGPTLVISRAANEHLDHYRVYS